MASEKPPPLYIPTNEFQEKKPRARLCTKSFLSWVLAALLIALIVALCVQFAFPIYERHRVTDIDTVHVFQGTPVRLADSHGEEFVKPPWHLDFLINPTRLCETRNPPDSILYQKDPEVKVLVLVPSAINHFEERRSIRKTWGSVAKKPFSPVRVGFVLGTTANSTEQSLLLEESARFGDLIQADFADTYRNLTTKSVLMLKWVSEHCPHAQYFLKADDDTFVNLDVLSRLVLKPPFDSRDRFIGGFIHRGAQPSRNPTTKYYVSESDYPDEEYPPYASGSAYLTTGQTAAQLFNATKRVKPMLPMEDIFVTGLCADDISASLVHDPCFQYTTDVSDPISWDRFSNLATAHSVSSDSMDALWNLMTKSLTDTIGLLEGGKSIDSDSSGLTYDSSPSIFDMLDLMGMRPQPMSMGNSESSSSSLENLFSGWPLRSRLFPDGLFDLKIKIKVPKDNQMAGQSSGYSGSILKTVEDAMNGQVNVKVNTDSPFSDMNFFPFGFGGKNSLFNMTYFMLK